eukprot:2025269-Amphidinium_carterae.1
METMQHRAQDCPNWESMKSICSAGYQNDNEYIPHDMFQEVPYRNLQTHRLQRLRLLCCFLLAR